MQDSEDDDHIILHLIEQLVGEATQPNAAESPELEPRQLGGALQLGHRESHFVEKLITQPQSPVLVPVTRREKIAFRLRPDKGELAPCSAGMSRAHGTGAGTSGTGVTVPGDSRGPPGSVPISVHQWFHSSGS